MFDKERFTESCLKALMERSPRQAIRALVAEAVADPASLEAELGTPETAGIQTLHRSPELTVLNVIWAPQMSIHPHNHETWAVIGIYGGQEDNTFYCRWPGGPGLERVNGRSLAEADTIVLGDETIHAVTNPRRVYTGAIHVYGGDFFAIPRSEWDSPAAPEQPYSVERTMKTFADANERAKLLLAGDGA